MESLVQGRTDCSRWVCRRPWAGALVGPQGLDLGAWLADGRLDVVKHGPHRSVYRLTLPGGEFYVKHFRSPTIWDRIRGRLLSSKARREWQNAESVAALGVPTTYPVARQEVRDGRGATESFLVTQAIPRTCTVDEFQRHRLPSLSPGEQATVRRHLIDDLARFVAQVHRAGIRHDDFHPGNLLVSLDGYRPQIDGESGRIRFHLIDVSGVRLSGPLSWTSAASSLAVFGAAWRDRLSKADRYRFWRAYRAARPDLPPPPADLLGRLLRQSEAHYRHRLTRRDRRTLRTSHDFVALRTAQGRSHGLRELAGETLRSLSATPEVLLWRSVHQPVKLDGGSVIVKAELPMGESSQYVAYKRYRPRSWWKSLLAPLRPARAVRSWQRGHGMLLRRIPTARPVAAVDRRRPWLQCESYLAMEWIEGSENLHLYLWRQSARSHADRMFQVNRCARSLGRVLGHMHSQRVLHGDLKGTNLLVTERHGDVQTWLIDVDDVRLDVDTTLARRATDLARLAVSVEAHPWISLTVRVRFLQAYLERFGRGAEDWKTLWRETAERSGRIVRRKRRRKQPIL